GYEYSKFTRDSVLAQGSGFFTDAFSFDNLSGATTFKTASGASESRLASFFGRANVGFKDRFFVTGVLRYDGSSKFAIGHKWAAFPALSASWRLSQEKFLAGGPFSDLRLRVGWGLQGNPGVDPYTSLVTLTSGSGATYPWGDVPHGGVTPSSNGNKDLKWEQTAQVNAAVDFGLLNNRLSGSVEYYVKNTKDLLVTVNVPEPALVPTQLQNVGKLRNSGLEVSLDAVLVSHPGLVWRAGLVFAAERSKVTDLGGASFNTGDVSGQGQSNVEAERIMVGSPLGTFYGPVFLGVDATGKQVFFCSGATKGCVGGRTTGGGGPDAADYRVIGNANPDFTLLTRSARSARLYVSADNLVLLTGYSGLDPEVFSGTGTAVRGIDYLTSPRARTVTGGLRLTF